MFVEVVSVEDAGFYSDAYTSGSTVTVTLQRDNEFAKCEGILIWEEEDAETLNYVFDEWISYAKDNVEGYTYWTE